MHILILVEMVLAFRNHNGKDGGKDFFSWLEQFVISKEDYFSHNIKSVLEEKLSRLINWFEKYFQ